MIGQILSEVALWCAAIPAGLFCCNLCFFRRPPEAEPGQPLPRLSVLIPARNEEANIRAAVESVLASRGVELECVVLDDASIDRTAEIVTAIALRDGRLRLEHAPALRAGWAGKAHAAHALSGLALEDVFCFIDADVRLAPDALARMLTLLVRGDSEMVSGFPEQITVTTLEWLLLPLIQFLLLGFLPMVGLRYTRMPSFGAGCGQFLMMTRRGYEATGGYAAIRKTMHDGIMMAKLFRTHGLHTSIADLTGLAFCRMYCTSREVWSGLTKNATEGIAAPARIVPFTFLLVCGQVLPWALLFAFLATGRAVAGTLVAACVLSLLPRVIAVPKFRQKIVGALLQPVAIVVFLVLQWCALLRKFRGEPAVWKGRAFEVG